MTSLAFPLVPRTNPRRVLADLIPAESSRARAIARDVTLVVAVAALTALAAQIRIPVPGLPVPITGQTFAVLLGAAALGPFRGTAAQVLYVGVGLVGLPVYAGGGAGAEVLFGASGGYLVGFVVAGAVVGALARRGMDRGVLGTVLAFAAGSAVIYAIGVPWLAVVAGMAPGEAFVAGAGVFLIGDAIKAALAGVLLPGAWRLARD
ncbi:biotin transporter BioY [Myceligenerans pegani]|uniref:Biotin transporter n=1 Tax=Myceligenerans pegani TaxID=2776917 RepID=A0ABR9MW61_9MICO|nr:biotin transporter BioY [Myceligenerans sp. TRM 65318]MBE1875626.1 biotin transporter BioY [Myceligenerans sp. TRM 65318]MBE3017897.1 biotin transporter BioY [Myceligenerans sp. TRM 65318]